MSHHCGSRVGKTLQWRGLQASGVLAIALTCGTYIPTGLVSKASGQHIADFVDMAEKAGLKAVNVFGGKNTSTYILESTGTGVAIFDYDNDGWQEIF